MQGLRTHGAGAGAQLAAHERELFDSAHSRVISDDDDLSRLLRLYTARVPPEWVDYNGHVHESRYLQSFGDASDAFFRYVGVDAAYLARAGSYFTAETHLSFVAQTRAEDSVDVTTQVLGFDEKRLHLYHVLMRQADGAILAEAEHLCLHVDKGSGRVTPAEAGVLSRVARVAEAHARLPRPARAGRRVGDPRP
jgi:carnitine 3-dehydrogenase